MCYYYKLLFIYYSGFPKETPGFKFQLRFSFRSVANRCQVLDTHGCFGKTHIFTHMQSNIINQLHVRILIVVDLTAVITCLTLKQTCWGVLLSCGSADRGAFGTSGTWLTYGTLIFLLFFFFFWRRKVMGETKKVLTLFESLFSGIKKNA